MRRGARSCETRCGHEHCLCMPVPAEALLHMMHMAVCRILTCSDTLEGDLREGCRRLG